MRRAGYIGSGSPANLGAQAHDAELACRGASRCAPEARRSRGARGRDRSSLRKRRRRGPSSPRCATSWTSARQRDASGFPTSIRSISATAASSPTAADRTSGHVLPDGRLGLDDRAHEGPGEALFHAAPRLPEAALPPGRGRLHPPHRRGEGGRRGDLLPQHRDRAARWCRRPWRRCAGIVAERYPPAGLEHLCRAGVGRRQSSPMQRAPHGCSSRQHAAAVPVLRLSRGRSDEGRRRRRLRRRKRAVAHLRRAAKHGAPCDAAGQPPAARSIPVFRELFRRREQAAEQSR